MRLLPRPVLEGASFSCDVDASATLCRGASTGAGRTLLEAGSPASFCPDLLLRLLGIESLGSCVFSSGLLRELERVRRLTSGCICPLSLFATERGAAGGWSSSTVFLDDCVSFSPSLSDNFVSSTEIDASLPFDARFGFPVGFVEPPMCDRILRIAFFGTGAFLDRVDRILAEVTFLGLVLAAGLLSS